ncbi:oxygenase MpaB family protein [Klebsiella pneumoniae]|nr:DUF2236 domain-containing protein [Klebsiella pneumoniae]
MIGIRRMIEAQVLGLTGMALKEIDFERPKGEPGLFGPQSAIWQVHGDFTSMLCGGISALLLQMLHPLALAGVWDHSRFREDILGRLRRTSQFISATTFATTPDAERLIAKVQGARDIPQTPQEVADYLEAMRPRLRCDERTREVAEVLLSTRLPGRMSQPVGRVMMNAGIDLLPEWAQEMLGLSLTPLQRRTTRLMVHGVARVLRASVRNGAWHCAMRRMTEA